MDLPVARRIVDFVAAAQATESTEPGDADADARHEQSGEIEPALLSLFCRGLNEERKRRQQVRFDDALLDNAKQSIISDYYRSCVEDLPDTVSRFIETELVTEKGFRNSYAVDDAVPAHLTGEDLGHLVNRRLLRVEERYGAERIELTHDLLTRAVVEHRTLRRAQDAERDRARRAAEERARLEAETARQRARVRVASLVAAACLALAGVAAYFWWEAAAERERADRALQTSQASELASQSQVVGATSPRAALELAVKAAELQPTGQSEPALRLALARARLRASLSPPPGVQFVQADASPSGRAVVLVRSDGVVEVREIPSLRPLHTLANSADKPVSAYFGATDGSVALVDRMTGVSVWNLSADTRASVFPGVPQVGVSARAVGRDRLLRRAGQRITLLDLSSRVESPVATCGNAGTPVAAVATERQLLLAFAPGAVVVCDARTGASRRLGAVGPQPLNAAAFSANGDRLIVSGYDEVVRVWTLDRDRSPALLRGFTGVPSTVAASSDGDVLVGVWDGTVEGWQISEDDDLAERNDRVFQLPDAREPVSWVTAVSDGQWVVTLHEDGPVRVWHGTVRTPAAITIFDRRPVHASVADDGRIVVVAEDGAILASAAGAAAHELASSVAGAERDFPVATGLSHDRTHALIAWQNGAVRVWNLASGRAVAEFREPHVLDGAVWATASCSVTSSSTRDPAASAGCAVASIGNRTIRLHVIPEGGAVVRDWPFPDALRPAGGLSLARLKWVGASESDVAILDLASGRIDRVREADSVISGWPFTANARAAVVRDALFAFILSLDKPGARPLRGHATTVVSTVVSPDGSTILTSSDDWTAKRWDAESGALLGTMRGHADGVREAMFRRDGQLVATTARDQSLRVWDAQSGAQLFRFELPREESFEARILDFKDSQILLGYNDGRVWTIECEPCGSTAAMIRAARTHLAVDVR
jgi:WD40 repeat protein